MKSLNEFYYKQAIEHGKYVEKAFKLLPESIILKLEPTLNGSLNIINSDVYHKYLMYKISAITFLVMTIESFMNSIIPDDFQFSKNDKTYLKSDIEKGFSFEDKIKKVIPLFILISDNVEYHNLYIKVLELYKLRNEFIHLKFSRDSKFGDPFLRHFESLINLNLNNSISDVKNFINYLRPDYL